MDVDAPVTSHLLYYSYNWSTGSKIQ